MYGYDLSSFDSYYGSAAKVAGGIASTLITISIITGVISILLIVAMCFLFKKENKPMWAAIIPVYNIIVLFQITNVTWWWIFIPFLNIVAIIMAYYRLGVAYSGTVYGILCILFPFVMIPIIAFSKKTRIENAVAPTSFQTVEDINRLEAKLETNQNQNININQVPLNNGPVNNMMGTNAPVVNEPMNTMNTFNNVNVAPAASVAPVAPVAPVVDAFNSTPVASEMATPTVNPQTINTVDQLDNQLINQNQTVPPITPVESVPETPVVNNVNVAFGNTTNTPAPQKTCPRCGSDITNVSSNVCPGCGGIIVR